MTMHRIVSTINGKSVEREVEARLTLADFLRHELRLTGTHLGCEHGVCGACTVVVDQKAVRSCLLFAVQVDRKHVNTVEALSTGDDLSPLQRAFLHPGYLPPMRFLKTILNLRRIACAT